MRFYVFFGTAALISSGFVSAATYYAYNGSRQTCTFRFDFGYSSGGVRWVDAGPGQTVSVENNSDPLPSCNIDPYNMANGSQICDLGQSFGAGETAVWEPGYLDSGAQNTGTYAVRVKLYAGSYLLKSVTLQPGESVSASKLYCSSGSVPSTFRAKWYNTSGSLLEYADWSNGDTAYPSWGGPPGCTAHFTNDGAQDISLVVTDTADGSQVWVGGVNQGETVNFDVPCGSTLAFAFSDPATGNGLYGNVTDDGSGNYTFTQQWQTWGGVTASVTNDGLLRRRYRFRRVDTINGVEVPETSWHDFELEPGDTWTYDGGESGNPYRVEVQQWSDLGWLEFGSWQATEQGLVEVQPPDEPPSSTGGVDGSRWDSMNWADAPPDVSGTPAPDGDADAQHRELINQLIGARQDAFKQTEAIVDALDQLTGHGPVQFGQLPFDMSASPLGSISSAVSWPTIPAPAAPSISVPLSVVADGVQDATLDWSRPEVDHLRLVVRGILLLVLTIGTVSSVLSILRSAAE